MLARGPEVTPESRSLREGVLDVVISPWRVGQGWEGGQLANLTPVVFVNSTSARAEGGPRLDAGPSNQLILDGLGLTAGGNCISRKRAAKRGWVRIGVNAS
jgi:hypothetical protein